MASQYSLSMRVDDDTRTPPVGLPCVVMTVLVFMGRRVEMTMVDRKGRGKSPRLRSQRPFPLQQVPIIIHLQAGMVALSRFH